ncbi:MAG TPA: YHS domain-containing protein, partial [Caulobacteraceae bacterium]|nr:YHS domain-containing protein [Caulobacteraceae bacterium]
MSAQHPVDAAEAPAPAKDPVCGMSVDPARTLHHAMVEGKDFHFCGAGCRGKFVADPQRYLNPRPPSPNP